MVDFSKYEEFLDVLMQDLHAIFDLQKEYIHCKEGCAYCCEQGEYPFSAFEFEYLMEGFKDLDEVTKQNILNEIEALKKNPEKNYKCPFLQNKICSVYNHRGIVCRTFGVITKTADGRTVLPFCHKYGLNYAEIYNPETKKLIPEALLSGKFEVCPRVFDLSYKNIMNLDLAKELNLEFGEERRLIDWFDENFDIQKYS